MANDVEVEVELAPPREKLPDFKGSVEARRVGLSFGQPTCVEYELYVKAEKEGIFCNLRHLYGSRHSHYYVDDSFQLDSFKIEALAYSEVSTHASLRYTSSRSHQKLEIEDGVKAFEHRVGIPVAAGIADLAAIGLMSNYDLYIRMPTSDVLERQFQFLITVRLRRMAHQL